MGKRTDGSQISVMVFARAGSVTALAADSSARAAVTHSSSLQTCRSK